MVSSGLLRRVVLTRATRRNNPEDTILHSHRRENLKSYLFCSVLFCSLLCFHNGTLPVVKSLAPRSTPPPPA
jgi:hypothetical protein